MTKEKVSKLLKLTGLIYAIAFIITTIVFIFFTSELMIVINTASSKFFPSLSLAESKSQFYLILSVSMMAGVSVCSFLLYKNTIQYINMAIPLITMKFTSSLYGLLVFVLGFVWNNGWNNLANLIIFLTDFPLGLWVLYLYRLFKQQYFY